MAREWRPLSYRTHRSGRRQSRPANIRGRPKLYQYDLRLLDQPAVDSTDTRLLLDHPMDNPRWLHHSGNLHYRPRTAVLGRSGLFDSWYLAGPSDRPATHSA